MDRNFEIMNNLKKQVQKSLAWTFADQIISQIVFLLFGIFLARILDPKDFGLVGMVTILTNFAILFIDMGFGVALIQKKNADSIDYSSIFWLNLAIGILLYLLFFFCAPYIGNFFKEPKLVILVRVICLSFIIASFTSVQSNLLIRELDFKKKALINWCAILLGYIVAFLLAYNHYGVWAIVFMTLTTSFVTSVLYWILSNWKPQFVFSSERIKQLSKIGLNVLGDTTINYWSRNYDNFIVGRVLGSVDLGIYTRAYSLMLLPLRNITSVIARVMFPAFSKIQDNRDALKRNYLQMIQYIAFISFPAMVGLSLVSKEFVLLFFGIKWSAMIPVLKILCYIGAIQSIVSLNGLIYNSLGKSNIAFRISIFVNIVLIISFTIGVQFGLMGVVWSYFFSTFLLYIPVYGIAIKQLNITFIEVFNTLHVIVFSCIAMAMSILITTYFLPNIFSIISLFIFKIVIGLLTYITSLYIIDKKYIINVLLKIKSFLR